MRGKRTGLGGRIVELIKKEKTDAEGNVKAALSCGA